MLAVQLNDTELVEWEEKPSAVGAGGAVVISIGLLQGDCAEGVVCIDRMRAL